MKQLIDLRNKEILVLTTNQSILRFAFTSVLPPQKIDIYSLKDQM
jgi:hypothetical protein